MARKGWTRTDVMTRAISLARTRVNYYRLRNDLRSVYVNRMVMEDTTGQPDFFHILLAARKMGSNPGSANY